MSVSTGFVRTRLHKHTWQPVKLQYGIKRLSDRNQSSQQKYVGDPESPNMHIMQWTDPDYWDDCDNLLWGRWLWGWQQKADWAAGSRSKRSVNLQYPGFYDNAEITLRQVSRGSETSTMSNSPWQPDRVVRQWESVLCEWLAARTKV